jgi:methylmalonyl-CoA mutase, C-terminal domain
MNLCPHIPAVGPHVILPPIGNRRCSESVEVLLEPPPLPSYNSFMENRIRVLVAKPGLDGHDRGAKVIARALRDAGMEVIYTGLRQSPEMIVGAALQEDVQVIGLSILSGAHNAIVPRVLELLHEKDMDDVRVVVGGIIPDEDAAELKNLGVAAVFQPGASLEQIIDFIRSSVKQTA